MANKINLSLVGMTVMVCVFGLAVLSVSPGTPQCPPNMAAGQQTEHTALTPQKAQVPPRSEAAQEQREEKAPRLEKNGEWKQLNRDGISLMLFGTDLDPASAAVAIKVDAALHPKANLAIVRIVYETHFGEIPIVLVKESVVQTMAEIFVMADPVPVGVAKVRSIRVILVQEVSKTEFDLREE